MVSLPTGRVIDFSSEPSICSGVNVFRQAIVFQDEQLVQENSFHYLCFLRAANPASLTAPFLAMYEAIQTCRPRGNILGYVGY